MQVLIRTDAGTTIGQGHLTRCQALAQAIQASGGQTTLAMTPQAITARIGSPEDAAQTIALAQAANANWIVTDGYSFGSSYQHTLRQAGFKLLAIDDCAHLGSYTADYVLNQNLHAAEALYPHRDPHTTLLLGPRYALLRPEFAPWRTWQRTFKAPASRILITLGGGDPENITCDALAALHGDLDVQVVIGPSNPHLAAVAEAASEAPYRVRVLHSVSDMASLMAWADLAITAAGSTCWETAFMGLPSVVVPFAANQEPVAHALSERGLAVSTTREHIAAAVEHLLAEPPEERSSKLRQLVDGQGAARVASRLRAAEFTLRPVQHTDCNLIWTWVNDPAARDSAFETQPIPWTDHVRWFHGKLTDPDCTWLLASDPKGTPLGQVRIEGGTIDISVAPDQRGNGLGVNLLRAAAGRAAERTLHAWVKPGNHASLRTFERAGFRNLGPGSTNGHAGIHFINP